jgi:hypothetical protein
MTPDFAFDYIDAVCFEYAIKRDVFFYRVRIPAAAEARAVCAYLLNKRRKASSVSVADWLKFKSHTSVLHSTRRVSRLMEESDGFRERVNAIERRVDDVEFRSDRGCVLRVLSDQTPGDPVALAEAAPERRAAVMHVFVPEAHAAFVQRDRYSFPSGPYNGSTRSADRRRPSWMRCDLGEAARLVRDEALREGRDRPTAARKHWEAERLGPTHRVLPFVMGLAGQSYDHDSD